MEDEHAADLRSNSEMLNRVLQKCHEVFPMGSGEMLRESCVKVAGWIMEAKRLEAEALEGEKQALESL